MESLAQRRTESGTVQATSDLGQAPEQLIQRFDDVEKLSSEKKLSKELKEKDKDVAAQGRETMLHQHGLKRSAPEVVVLDEEEEDSTISYTGAAPSTPTAVPRRVKPWTSTLKVDFSDAALMMKTVKESAAQIVSALKRNERKHSNIDIVERLEELEAQMEVLEQKYDLLFSDN
jgi:hypothetical protein